MRTPGVAVAVASVVLSGCVPAAVTDRGRDVAWLYDVFFAVAIGVFLLIAGLLTWTVVRHRGQPGRAQGLASTTEGNLALEVAWWATPTLIVVALAVLTAVVLSRVDARAAEPSVTVQVEGFQWGWRFTYEEAGVVVAGTAAQPPTIALPVGESVAFVITARDVVHSFNIPPFLIKRDAIPNQENRFDVVIEQEGTYGGQCGEFCGLLHAQQLFAIDAVQPAAFDEWLAAEAAAASPSPAASDAPAESADPEASGG